MIDHCNVIVIKNVCQTNKLIACYVRPKDTESLSLSGRDENEGHYACLEKSEKWSLVEFSIPLFRNGNNVNRQREPEEHTTHIYFFLSFHKGM